MREIIRASAWGGFRELVADLGGNADEIFAAARIDPAALAEGDRYMPLRAFIDCQEIAAARLHRPDFGLLFGQRQDISMLGPLSIAIVNAPTAREGIEICARFMHIHNPAVSMTLAPIARTTRDFLGITFNLKRQSGHDQNCERMLSSFHKSMRGIGGADYKPREVWFMHKPLSALSVYRNVFGVTPLFGKPQTGIAIDRAVLDAWQPGRSPQLRQIAETYLSQIAPPRAASFTSRVSNMIRSLLRGGECTPEQLAAALGVHERTLQRRLKAEGVTFEKIKDDVRREMAEALLAQPSVPLSQIAVMLDYADASAFSRSARRWFGESPRAHRKGLIDHPPAFPEAPRPARVSQSAKRRPARSKLASL